MAHADILTNVPKAKLCEIIEGAIEDGAIQIILVRNPATGKWNVTIVVPEN